MEKTPDWNKKINWKKFPNYGCICDLSDGEPLTDCVINIGVHGDCDLAVTSWTKDGQPRLRKTPNNCKYWVVNNGAKP